MSIYVQAKTKSFGEFFANCGSKTIAGRVSNINDGAGKDASIAHSYTIDLIASSNGSSFHGVAFGLGISAPVYGTTISSAFNSLNGKDEIEKLILTVVERAPVGGKNEVIRRYTAENGTLTSATVQENEKSSDDNIALHFEFEKVFFEDLKGQTSGQIKTTDGGY